MSKKEQAAYDRALKEIEDCRHDGRTRLDLSDLGLTHVPPEIGQLTALTWLALHGNQLTTLPPVLGQLTALTELYLDHNQLTTVPSDIGQLTALRALRLHSNQLATLPPEIGKLNALTKLYLDQNQLTTLPPELGKLKALETLDLSGNQLSTLPTEIVQLAALAELFLQWNPELRIPDSVLGPTYAAVYQQEDFERAASRPQDILNYYFARRQGAVAGTLRAVNEIKVMLVGRGGAGKTSLRRFFIGVAHDKAEKETPGIALDSFSLRCAQGDMTVRLWDFAGQEITHALHQFFLTEGCVYVLVLDPRSNTEMRDAEYWLGLLSRYAGGAPVLVALNRQDARKGGYDVDRRVLKERFPFLQSFTPTNCEKRDGCKELMQNLCGVVESLTPTEPPHLMVPGSWLEVMKDCRGETTATPRKEHLTLEEFRAICVKHGEREAEKQESLARLLHKLGAVLHFVDEPRLRDTTVLNPHWVTDGVYRLLRFKDRPGSDGTLTLAEALAALPGESESEARFFLRLMERFEMCFPLDEQDDGAPPKKWLIPGALGEFQPEGVSADWQKPGSVRLRYVYKPLPEGVLPRFIVMTHLLSEGKPRWRNGVILQDGAASALVRRGEDRNHVEVTAFGPEPERLRLLEIIQGNLERIHADLPEPRPVAELELAGLPGIYRPVADLEAAEKQGVPVAVKTPAIEAQVQPTPQLNQASEQEVRTSDRVPLNTFLSYAHEDRKAQGVFQMNLTVMTKKKFIAPWHDGLIEPGTRWLEEIEENLAKMDIFVGLLTTAFLASDFIERVELKAAREKLRKHGKEFIFVLILVDDISLTELNLAEYQILKPGGKAVTQHASRKVGFNQAQKELEALVLKRQAVKKSERTDESMLRPPTTKALEKEGVTIIVQGDYIRGDKSMNDDISINIHGDNYGQAGQTLTNCTNMIQQQAPGEKKTALEALEKEAKALIAKLPEDKKEDAAGNLELAVKGATSATPNRKWYDLSAEGLIEASKFVKDFSGNIVGTIKNLGKAVWPDFSLPEGE